MSRPPSPAADWFARRTFSAADYDVAGLAAVKATTNTCVSVVLPSRDEAPTITRVIEACLQLQGVLVDEVIVIDGDSTDGTRQLAADAGAVVYDRHALLPHAGPAMGKGDALWRSLSVARGDLVVFCDSDIRNPAPDFITGLLGPLLADPDVELVKAFYDRPMQVGEFTEATGGGRVTELMARPLLNMFWPELAGLIQPLSGEYAARRTLLEELPFFTGYGVEIGLLVDTLNARGAYAIGQVDLTERVHRNQPVDALSRMAFGILQVAARRLSDDGRLRGGLLDLAQQYVQFERHEGQVQAAVEVLRTVERPALKTFDIAC